MKVANAYMVLSPELGQRWGEQCTHSRNKIYKSIKKFSNQNNDALIDLEVKKIKIRIQKSHDEQIKLEIK